MNDRGNQIGYLSQCTIGHLEGPFDLKAVPT